MNRYTFTTENEETVIKDNDFRNALTRLMEDYGIEEDSLIDIKIEKIEQKIFLELNDQEVAWLIHILKQRAKQKLGGTEETNKLLNKIEKLRKL